MKAPELFPASSLASGGSARREGLLGVVVRDRHDGQFYGLTVLELFERDVPVLAANGMLIRLGKRVPKFEADVADPERLPSVDRLVAIFEIGKGAVLLDRHPNWETPIGPTVDAATVANETWLTLQRKGPPLATSLVGYGVSFDLEVEPDSVSEGHGGEVTLQSFRGGLEVELASGQGPHSSPGDAGAPVVTKGGQLIGIVVALESTSAIVAPLHDLLRRWDVEVFGRAMLSSEGSKAAASSISAPQPAALVAASAIPFKPVRPAPRTPMRVGGARIAGVNIPANKRVLIALQYIHGIGPATARDIINKVGIDDWRRVNELTDEEVLHIREVVDRDYTVEGDLRRETSMNIKRLMDLACYRGLRHRKGLPVRGQRTRSNARTRKGPAKTVAGRKK